MTKPGKTREEPKLRIDDLEDDESGLYKKKWPREEDFQEDLEEELVSDEADVVGILEHPSYKELERKLTEAETKVNEYWNQQVRDKAEIDNVRRRAERDVSSAHKYALERFAAELLPVVDSLERALLSDVGDNALAEKIHQGIELTMSLFLKTLEKFGIKQVDPLGQPFNPELHQAIATKPSDQAPNTVVEVLQKGYTLNDRLVRPALVVVAS